MKRQLLLTAALLPTLLTTLSAADFNVTGPAFYGDPPDANHPWGIHDRNRPQPPRVEPGTFSSQEQPGKPPSDAIVLFDGTEASLKNWVSAKKPEEATKWVVNNGALQCVPGVGDIRTKESFGDCQLHVEWAAPTKIEGESQGRGNSGIFPMSAVEVQVLDNYNNPTYADGFAGSVYGVNPPHANALNKPTEWQVYDIIFRRPIYKDGKEVDPGSMTVFVNGVLVQENTPLEGGGGHKGRSKPKPFPESGPLKLQDHGNDVRYRNIWYRALPKRAVEGGTDGFLTEEATKAKRSETAAFIRKDAAGLQGNAKMLRLWESIVYAQDEAALQEATKLATDYIASIKAIPAGQLESKKGEVLQVNSALEYLTKYKILPGDYAPRGEVLAIVKANEWDKKK